MLHCKKNSEDLCHKHWAVKVSVLLPMGSPDQECVIMTQSTAGKHLLVQISYFPIHINRALANARVGFFFFPANLFPDHNVIGIHTTWIFHTTTYKLALGAHVKTTMWHLMKWSHLRGASQSCTVGPNIKVGFLSPVFPGLSGDNAGTKKGGDGLWWQEVWKDKDSGDTEHIKTQIRLAPLRRPSPSARSCTCWGIRACVCKPCEIVHVSWSLCVCVCPHNVGVPACLYDLTVGNGKTVPMKGRRRQTEGRGGWKSRACIFLLLPENQSSEIALHYTLLLTTGRPCSLRGKEERAAECTAQIIFIWDPGGYWQTGGAFR